MLIDTGKVVRAVLSETDLSERIKCKVCGVVVPNHKYHLHVMAFHRNDL